MAYFEKTACADWHGQTDGQTYWLISRKEQNFPTLHISPTHLHYLFTPLPTISSSLYWMCAFFYSPFHAFLYCLQALMVVDIANHVPRLLANTRNQYIKDSLALGNAVLFHAGSKPLILATSLTARNGSTWGQVRWTTAVLLILQFKQTQIRSHRKSTDRGWPLIDRFLEHCNWAWIYWWPADQIIAHRGGSF